MSPRRARIIRRQALALATLPAGYLEQKPSVRQEIGDGKIRRFFTNLKEALKGNKAYRVTGQIIKPRQAVYRRMKRLWTRRRR